MARELFSGFLGGLWSTGPGWIPSSFPPGPLIKSPGRTGNDRSKVFPHKELPLVASLLRSIQAESSWGVKNKKPQLGDRG